MQSILEDLTDAQRQAVTHINGPLLVIAGPGSGKTRVITRRIAHLVYCGIRPWSILAITFTNKAANEMRERVESLGAPKGIWLSTFHSYCARVLREFADRVGYRKDFSIYDEDDSLKIIQELMKGTEIARDRVTPRGVKNLISAAKEQGIGPDDYEPSSAGFTAITASHVYPEYQKRLKAANAMDFDDLLMKAAHLLRSDGDALAKLRQRHQFVLVDEFQDTNRSQYSISKLLTQEHRNICATGDPDQSIYGWRGADVHNILDFEKDFPEAVVVKLDRNYRSTKTILAAADRLVSSNTQRKPRTLYTSNPDGEKIHLACAENGAKEAEHVVAFAKDLLARGFSAGGIAVFYRVNSLSREVEEAFVAAGLPYQIVGGVAFYSRREVKDILAYLRFAVNRGDDASLERIINVPPRSIGAKTVANLKDCARAKQTSIALALETDEGKALLTDRTKAAVDAFLAVIGRIASEAPRGARSAVEIAVNATGYLQMLLASGKPEDKERAENLAELLNAAAQFDDENPGAGVVGFLEQVALVADVDSWRDRQDRVTLMTMHAAKGLEFPAVIIIGLDEGILPHTYSSSSPRELEEERRVFFVAMTRAMRELFLLRADERMIHGNWRYSPPSRFLKEIPEELIKLERLFEPTAVSAPAVSWRPRHAAVPRVHVQPQVRDVVPTSKPVVLSDGIPAPGTRVRHNEFGNGVVTHVLRQGQWHKLTVDFRPAGEKKLIFEMATLEILK